LANNVRSHEFLPPFPFSFTFFPFSDWGFSFPFDLDFVLFFPLTVAAEVPSLSFSVHGVFHLCVDCFWQVFFFFFFPPETPKTPFFTHSFCFLSSHTICFPFFPCEYAGESTPQCSRFRTPPVFPVTTLCFLHLSSLCLCDVLDRY